LLDAATGLGFPRRESQVSTRLTGHHRPPLQLNRSTGHEHATICLPAGGIEKSVTKIPEKIPEKISLQKKF